MLIQRRDFEIAARLSGLGFRPEPAIVNLNRFAVFFQFDQRLVHRGGQAIFALGNADALVLFGQAERRNFKFRLLRRRQVTEQADQLGVVLVIACTLPLRSATNASGVSS